MSSQSCSQPGGCDIAVKGPEEVDNSTGSRILDPDGRNKLKIPPAAGRLRDGPLRAEGDRLMGLPHVDTVDSADTPKHRSSTHESVFTDMWLLSVKRHRLRK